MIIDSSSMAGHVISKYLQSLNEYKIINMACDQKLNKADILIDLEDKDDVNNTILDIKPEIIINCIRVLIKESEENPARAIYLNSFFPHYLKSISKTNNIKIIHLSTDCVFSGQKGSYSETDIKDGKGYYAETKALGEIINNRDLNVRTSYIGPNTCDKSEELFHWFMTQKGTVQGYSRVFWTGITTLELAKAIEAAIEQELSGLYHLVPDEKISKYELLKLIKEVWKRDEVTIEENRDKASDKSLLNTRTDFNYRVRGYAEMLSDLHEWMNAHRDIYNYKY